MSDSRHQIEEGQSVISYLLSIVFSFRALKSYAKVIKQDWIGKVH
jgi:hypothetical protein